MTVDKGISDNEVVFVQITYNERMSTQKEAITNVPNFYKADNGSIIDLSFALDSFDSQVDINAIRESFKGAVFHCIKNFVPLRKRTKA